MSIFEAESDLRCSKLAIEHVAGLEMLSALRMYIETPREPASDL